MISGVGGGGGMGADSHIKKTGILFVSLSGCKLQSLVSFRVVEMESYYMHLPIHVLRLVLYIKKFTKNALTLTTQKSPVGVSLNLSHTHICLLWSNLNFPTSISATFLWESPPPPPENDRLGNGNTFKNLSINNFGWVLNRMKKKIPQL